MVNWNQPRLHVVSGKGGTGKTTVAAALALALAAGGRRTLLVEVEDRQGIAQLFDTPPLPYEERKVAVAPGGGDVYALAIDTEEALLDYLDMFYNLRRAGSALRRMGAIEFATTIAPGLRDVLLTGKFCEAVKRTDKRGFVYDAVVVDAPPTGRVTRFLNVNREVAGIAKVGPIKTQADSVMRVIHSPSTQVHLVTLLEEMPVQETVDGVEALREADLPAGRVFVNMLRRPMLDDDELESASAGTLDRAMIAAGLKAAGVVARRGSSTDAIVEALAAEARDHAERVALERQERARLDPLGLPVITLPLIDGGIDLTALYELAELLREQGLA
jgi:anion-transporting  ArsA/GET3 family ATPase